MYRAHQRHSLYATRESGQRHSLYATRVSGKRHSLYATRVSGKRVFCRPREGTSESLTPVMKSVVMKVRMTTPRFFVSDPRGPAGASRSTGTDTTGTCATCDTRSCSTRSCHCTTKGECRGGAAEGERVSGVRARASVFDRC
jgi:hypothetical protein